MKTLLAVIVIIITTAICSQAGPSWGFTLGNGAGFYYGNGNNWGNRGGWGGWGGGGCYVAPPVYVGPQYYTAYGINPCSPVVNYSNAPLVVPGGPGYSRRIIPRSW